MWMFLVFLGVFLHAITNHIDNFLVGESEKTAHVSTGSLIIFSAFAGIFGVGLSLYFGTGMFDVGLSDRLILVGVGCIEMIAVLLYLYALGEDEVTSVSLWWSLSPVFGLIAGYLVLGETVNTMQLIGIGIVVLASIALAFKRSEAQWVFKGKITALMLGSSILYGIMYVLFKFSTVGESAFWASSFWQYLGMILLGTVLFAAVRSYRDGFIALLQKSGKVMMGGNIANEILYLAGIALSTFSALSVPVAFVLAAENIQPLFVLITSFIISRFVPGYDADDLSRAGVTKKLLLIALMAIGLYLLG